MPIALIVLAAGKGTRMSSDLPKVLHRIAQAPMLWHAMRAGSALGPEATVVVAGHGADAVRDAAREFDPDAQVALQTEQLGTAHAVAQARPALDGFDGEPPRERPRCVMACSASANTGSRGGSLMLRSISGFH